MKSRKDSFFGLHFDFHGHPKYGETQGATLREEDIREICRAVKPDFIQIDCKGHPGWASYPSELGNALPDFAFDTLALWRRVTKEEGVALYMHYSGVYDNKYLTEHPEENIMRADGTYAFNAVRPNGKYVDDLLIPQISEITEKYGVDGFWIDGDCWKPEADFRPESIAAFEREYGVDLGGRLPATPDDPYYYEYRNYHRELFRRYLRYYVDTLHEKYPELQICSNWSFSDHMPEKVCANVDFLSGDLNPTNSFNSARYAARALAQQDMPWDLMSWNFRIKVGNVSGVVAKHPRQVMQEAAAVIATGGAYQNYITQYKDGSPRMHEVRDMAELSEFLRARQPYCFRGKLIHQAALLLSSYDRSFEEGRLYNRTGYEKIMGMTALLCDIGQSLEIICEHTLKKLWSEYEMIVVPELFYGLERETVELLLSYAKGGGKLVVVGNKTCRIFAEASGAFGVVERSAFLAEGEKPYDNGGDNGHGNISVTPNKPYCFTLDGRAFGIIYAPCEIAAGDAKVAAMLSDDDRSEQKPLAVTLPYGEGSISAIGADIGSQYLVCTQYLQRELMKAVVAPLYEPMVRIESQLGRLEIVCLDLKGKKMIQLINAAGSHANDLCATDDLIPPALDIELSIALSNAPRAVILQPEGRELSFEYRDGRAYLEVERVDIHSVLEIVE